MPTFQPDDNIQSIKTVKRSNGMSKFFTNILLVLTILFLCTGGYFVYSAATTSNTIFDAENNAEECSNWFCTARQGFAKVTQVLSPDGPIKGQNRGRTNFLILGLDATPGGGLSDTIMIVSYFHQEKKIVTVNVPRDFLVQYKTLDQNTSLLGNSTFKINELYRAATQRGLNGGRELSNFISKEFGIPIDYWITANFDAVEKTVETIGGIDINVENSFVDCEYPNRDYSGLLPCQTFVKGQQKMNATKSLIYARSRHGDNGEGSDFARGRRQSAVVSAILQKIKSQNLLSTISNLNSLFSVLGSNVKTSMNISELKSLVSSLRNVDLKKNYDKVIWSVGNGFLCDQTTQDFGYHIFYCDGEIGGSTAIISAGRNEARQQIKDLLLVSKKDEISKISFEIYGNGSSAATKASTILANLGFESVVLNNNETQIPITSGNDILDIYISDSTIYNQIDSLNLASKFSSKVKVNLINSKPEGLPIDNNNPSDVIIWAQ
jgi:polyisoprenyl-teichoic acid--peptidoglycan teichoic acid transferase